MIEHKIGRLLVVDTLEESDATSRLVLLVLLIDKGSYAPDDLILIIFHQPAGAFSFFKEFIFRRVEFFFYILIQRAYPVGVILVKRYGQFQEGFPVGVRFHLVHMHGANIIDWPFLQLTTISRLYSITILI